MWYIISEGHGQKLVNDKNHDVRMASEGGTVYSRSPGYKTKKECLEKQGCLPDKCTECGGVVTTEYREPLKSELTALTMCFHCYHWFGWYQRSMGSDLPNIARIGGSHYFISPDTKHGFKGFGGREFRIRFDDGREAVTHNLWHQGDIPDHFKDRLPDNAKFIQS